MKTKFLVVAVFVFSVGDVFARPPKVAEPLFQGRPDSVFVEWVAEKTNFPTILNAPSIADVEPFWVHLKIDEAGKIVDVKDPKEASSQLEYLVRTVLLTSPEWTPAYDRKKPQLVGYNLFMRPAERSLKLLKVEDCEQVMPTFQGGDVTVFRDWVQRNIIYPETLSEVAGRVVLKFVVETDGSVTIEEFPEMGWREFGIEVARVVAMCPKWTPGTLEGVPARVCNTLPINFKLEE